MIGGCQKSEPPANANGSSSGSGGMSTQIKLGSGAGSGSASIAPAIDLDTKEILSRSETFPEVQVKHVLIGWKDLAAAYQGQMDPRAGQRTNADAAKLAQDVFAKLKANPDSIDAAIKEHSEDPGSLTGDPYTITAGSHFVPEFMKLALRLKEREAGIVKTTYGYHVMMRVPPPLPDPLESTDIMSRPAEPGPMPVQHILIGWKESPAAKDLRAKNRTKADADKLATEVLAKVRNGGDMAKLMKQYSEDPGSKDTARAYDVSADAPLVDPFKKLSMRLKVGEAGLVKTPFGWHIIKRIPPPPPDSMESTAILKREPPGAKAKVKHILLGWKDAHAEDKRGIERTRPELEKLVKATLAKLAKGDKIEPLMKELSEDPGSAASGEGYDVSPAVQLVPPFKNLSLRLKLNEVGVVKTEYGLHIIQRVE